VEEVMMATLRATTFNSPLEAGVRAVGILLPAYPQAYDLQRLVAFDYLVVHTGDIGGPQSLHPRLPLRSAELLVRRKLVERGLLLMMSQGLVERIIDTNGISYRAGELAETFLSTLTSPYLIALRERGDWVVNTFGNMDDDTLRQTMKHFFGQWIEEFQATQRRMEAEA
jgi:hypothetical protein